MTKKIAVRKAASLPINPFDQDNAGFNESLTRRKANRASLTAWLQESLVEGVDFGRIHTAGKSKCQFASQGRSADCTDPAHWSKPVMFKPGAEKVCGMLGVTVHFPNMAAYEQAAISGGKILNIILRCELRNAQGAVVAEGVGARSVEKDYYDLNKALKMAEKSAHIDATLRMGGLSELFTQDEPAVDADECLNEEHRLIFFNMLVDTGLFASEEIVNRQLENLARALGKKSLLEMPLTMFDTCKAQLERGIEHLRQRRAASVQEPIEGEASHAAD